jgi:hypothetical protein
MASLAVAAGNDRRFSWDDDDEDDFDLDTWRATVDTSSPSVDELGPLQLSLCEEKFETTVIRTMSCNDCKDPYQEAPTSNFNDTAVSQCPVIDPEGEYAPEPEAIEAPTEAAYNSMLDLITEEQIAFARHEYLTHAIGIYFDGKDEADAPAYPELSAYNGQRYQYAKAFQNVTYMTGRRKAEVYRHSPLILVTGIEDAHLIDDRPCNGVYEEASETREIQQYEQEELNEPQPDFVFTYEEDEENVNRQVKLPRLPALEHFSKDELEELIGMWRTQQDEDGVGCFNEEEEQDSSSIDTWERSESDEEEILEPLGEDIKDDPNMFSVVRPLEPRTFTHDEELDFNDVVFYRDYETGGRDEGYVSSSPPISPVLGTLVDGAEWQAQHVESPLRPKRASRVDSMDALDAIGAVDQFIQEIGHHHEKEVAEEMVKASQDGAEINEGDDEMSQITHHQKCAVVDTSLEKEAAHSVFTVNAATWQDIGEENKASTFTTTPTAQENERRTPAGNIPNTFPTFLPPSANANIINDRETAVHYTAPSIIPPTNPYPDPEPAHQRSLAIAHLTSIFALGVFYITKLPWTTISIITAGAIVGGSMSVVTRDAPSLKLN